VTCVCLGRFFADARQAVIAADPARAIEALMQRVFADPRVTW
jgi:hypothetical protein